MADFDDIDEVDDKIDVPIDRGSSPGFEPPPPSDGPPLLPIAAGGAVLILLLGALWYFGTRSAPAPGKPAAVAQTTVNLPRERRAEPGEAIDLPPLDQSDAIVRTLAGKLSSHPTAAAWLTTNGLVRNIVVVVANIADGDTPAKHLKPIKPTGAFATRMSGGHTFINPATYGRYDNIAAAADGLDARGVARFYATIKPRIDDAYHELMGPDASFDPVLERAIVMLLRTPIVEGDVQLGTGKVTYTFDNPALESLTKVQRQFLRMGPQNVRIVKAKLRDVAGYLGIPDTRLPPPDGAPPSR